MMSIKLFEFQEKIGCEFEPHSNHTIQDKTKIKFII